VSLGLNQTGVHVLIYLCAERQARRDEERRRGKRCLYDRGWFNFRINGSIYVGLKGEDSWKEDLRQGVSVDCTSVLFEMEGLCNSERTIRPCSVNS
jgi:hypothetical protein